MKYSVLITRVITACFLLAGIAVAPSLQAQCYKPEPMNFFQVNTMKGTWKGTYKYMGSAREVTIKVYTSGGEVICDVDVPPVEGRPDSCMTWFCPGGEFHLKRFIGNKTYSFQGTPVNGIIGGIMVVKENDKTLTTGRFEIEKVETL